MLTPHTSGFCRYNPRRRCMDELLRPWHFALLLRRTPTSAAGASTPAVTEGTGSGGSATPPADLEVNLRAVNTFHMDVPDAFVAAAAALFRAWGPDHPRITEVWASAATVPASSPPAVVPALAADGGSAAVEPTIAVTVELPALVLQLVTDVSMARRPIVTVSGVLLAAAGCAKRCSLPRWLRHTRTGFDRGRARCAANRTQRRTDQRRRARGHRPRLGAAQPPDAGCPPVVAATRRNGRRPAAPLPRTRPLGGRARRWR